MLVIKSRGGEYGMRRYAGSGIFDSITRKMFASGLKKAISTGANSVIAPKVADDVVNGATSASQKAAEGVVNEAINTVKLIVKEGLKKNIVLLNSENTDYFGDSMTELSNDERFTIHPLAHHLDKYKETIFLYYISGWHFLLVGYFNGSYMQTVFDNNKIPEELYEVYKRDCKII